MSDKLTPYQELYQKSLSQRLTAIEKCILFHGIYVDEESGIEAAEHYAALRTAARDAYDFLMNAPFDFKNGNEFAGTDEGEYYGTRTLKRVTDALAARLDAAQGGEVG